MQRGFKFLIISGVLFLSSITVFFIWGMSFSEMFILNNEGFSTNQISLEPQSFYNSTIYVNSTSNILTITIDTVNSDQIQLNEIIFDPNNNVISNSTFQKTYFSTISPEILGEYRLAIFNNDRSNDANMYVFFGNLPFLTETGEVDISSFGGLIAGAILFLVGLSCLVIGVIFFLKDKNRERYHGYIPR